MKYSKITGYFKVIVFFMIIIAAGLLIPAHHTNGKLGEYISQYSKKLDDKKRELLYQRAKYNLTQILICQQLYQSRTGSFLDCPPNPPKIPSGGSLEWASGDKYKSWDDIGFRLDGPAFYQYRVKAGAKTIRIMAVGDIDGDGKYSKFILDEKNKIREQNPLE